MSENSVSIPTKDCSKCQRRRIKCDRTWPGCKKCGKRFLECPGYGLKLKWVQGVASRGMLKGRSLPVRNSPLVLQPPTGAPATLPLPDPSSRLIHSPGLFHSLHSPRLVAWFTERVAQRLAWVDGPRNPWRRIVLPLAETHETVLLSILALAATDISSQFRKGDPWFEIFKNLSQTYHRHALNLLTYELKGMCALPPSQTRSAASFFPTLVSVMIICNKDILNAETLEWRMHLTAAREILAAANDCSDPHQSFAPMREFFLQEYYTTSVWTQLMNFNQMGRIVMDPPTSNEDAALTGFVNVIHQITQLERTKAGLHSSDVNKPHQLHDQGIYTEIESARADSLRLGQSINFWSDTHRQNFNTLVRMYYHATLIYSDQALSMSSIASTNMKASQDHIMNDLRQLSQLEAGFHHAQDFIWPLFIAGTELRGNFAGQALVECHFKTVMRISRTLDRDRVLSFLRSWWEQDSDRQTSWIQYARERSSDYNLIIV